MSFVCHLDVICMRSYLSLCTLMSPVCHSFVLVYHPYVPRMYSYAIHMSLVCTRMSSVFLSYVPVCHSYVLVCHPYVTRIYSYVICMLLVCGFTMNHYHKNKLIFANVCTKKPSILQR